MPLTLFTQFNFRKQSSITIRFFSTRVKAESRNMKRSGKYTFVRFLERRRWMKEEMGKIESQSRLWKWATIFFPGNPPKDEYTRCLQSSRHIRRESWSHWQSGTKVQGALFISFRTHYSSPFYSKTSVVYVGTYFASIFRISCICFNRDVLPCSILSLH